MKHASVACFVPMLGCPHRCSFCDQAGITGAHAPTPQEAADLAREALPGVAGRDAEFAFFGGSFTMLPAAEMEALLAAVSPFCGPGGYRGIRLSTRPDAIDGAVLARLGRYPVTAVELGAQSMDDAVLAANGRGHTARQVEDAARAVKAAGFELGLQMMTGLYRDTDDGAWRTVRALCALKPDTLRIYPTLVLRNTPLERLWRAGAYRPRTLDEAVDLCAGLLEVCNEQGVRVIRVGLHAQRSLADAYLAGPMHPAFRELCENRIYLNLAREALRDRPACRTVALGVADGEISKLAGQNRRNLDTLESETGLRLSVRGCAGLAPYQIRLFPEG